MNDKKRTDGIASEKAEKLLELVDYAQDSIVSRTLMGNKSGTVTMFAFTAGQALSKHSAPFDALVNVLDGEAKITIGEDDFVLKGGEILMMPADIPHLVEALENSKILLVMIKGK